jgi:hypothetical protein
VPCTVASTHVLLGRRCYSGSGCVSALNLGNYLSTVLETWSGFCCAWVGARGCCLGQGCCWCRLEAAHGRHTPVGTVDFRCCTMGRYGP